MNATDRDGALVWAWCRGCGTQHASDSRCPVGVDPTGPEERAWKVAVETPRGLEGYGVLLAPAGRRWRSRILTFPNILWMIPGGGESIKFFGATEDDAVRSAVNFIRRHCVHKGYLMRDEVQYVSTPTAPLIAPDMRRAAALPEVAPRFHCRLPVQFGRSKPILIGQTDNVSESGLFVSTEQPLPDGELVGLQLDLAYCKVPLRGAVVWLRAQPLPGLPPGMGLRLLRPPTIYVSYVRALIASAGRRSS